MYNMAKIDLERIEQSESKPGEKSETRFSYDLDNSDGGRRAVYGTFRRAGLLGSR